jgi:NAD-dependent dihydropyrimidine dehydrogenase PreA subunit
MKLPVLLKNTEGLFMKRKIININEEKCTGCGQCIPDCPEGAIQLIEGKARLVSDLFCDGLGACIGTCPEGAISIIEREAEAYNEKTVMANIVRQGKAVIKAHLEHLSSHGEKEYYNTAIEYLTENKVPIPEHNNSKNSGTQACENQTGTCPGSATRIIKRDESPYIKSKPDNVRNPSELRQWPVQLKLLNPSSSFFDDADLLVAADCVPFAYPNFHTDFLTGRILIIFCPKLDSDIEGYISKLSEIFSNHEIKSITVLHMEVPCCGGVRVIIESALKKAGKKVTITDKTIQIDGSIKQ